MLSVAVIALLLSWFLLTIPNQFRSTQRILARFDPFHLLPRWTFFAPNPGTADYHLLYQDVAADGSCSSWVEAPLTDQRRISHLLWNPGKRRSKVLADFAQSLCCTASETDAFESAVLMSTPYLCIMHYLLRHFPPGGNARMRHFMIVLSDGHRGSSPKVVFVAPQCLVP
jgi:hypothetical protein